MHSSRYKIAFICVHNSCRSQIAEALGHMFYHELFESCSAGTEKQTQINQDAVRLLKEHYSFDMEKNQHSKLLQEIAPVDIIVTMGCNVACPNLPCLHQEDWGLADPSHQGDEVMLQTIKIIEEKIHNLASRIKLGQIPPKA